MRLTCRAAFVPLLALNVTAACGASNATTTVTCGAGRTVLDGVCVREQVADYVACVRAQGAQLGSAQSERLAADVRGFGVKAGAAREVSEQLQKKYTVSDAATISIIETCNKAAGFRIEPVPVAEATTTCPDGMVPKAGGGCESAPIRSEPRCPDGSPPRPGLGCASPVVEVPRPAAVASGAWSAAADFSTTRNPNGAWSSGWMLPLGSQVHLYSTATSSGNPQWYDSAIASGDHTPTIWKNAGNATEFGVEPGQVSLHPGPGGQYSVLRWTAPTSQKYSVAIQAFAGDRADESATLFRNGSNIWHAPHTGTDSSFAQVIALNAGDTLDLAVGGNYAYGNTPVSFTVSPLSWNATADFSTVRNPNGAWSAGWMLPLGSQFHLYPTVTTQGVQQWYDAAIPSGDHTPTIWKNTGSTTEFGVAPGQLSLHPGPRGQYSVLRWTATTSQKYNVVIQAFAGDRADESATLFRNGTSIWSAPQTGTHSSFAQTMTLNAGDTLDLAIGGNYAYGNTPVAFTVEAAKH